MLPPQWALRNSRRLDLEEFGSWFAEAWSQVQSRFLKLECWQTYQEREINKSQDAYNKGHVDKARELLRQEAEADRPLYEGVRARGLDYARIRLVQEPLTPYLEYELMAYRVRDDMGETIEIVRCGRELSLPNDEYFDFLLFDRHTALIHDYGDEGLQSGGWLTTDSDVIVSLQRVATDLRRSAIPLREFVAGLKKQN
jgi:hypothetical protein